MVSTLLVLWAVAQPGPAPTAGYSYRADEKTLWVTAPDGRSYQAKLPCAGTATAVGGEQLFVACGDEGVAVLSLASPSTPQLVGVRDLGATVTGFHEAGGAVWAELWRREARLLAPGESVVAPAPPAAHPSHAAEPPPAAPPVPTPAPLAPPVMVAVGEVLEERPSSVVVTLGTGTGLAVGDRVALFVLRDAPLGGGQTATREELLAVGEAVAVSGDRAEVELGRNESVPPGARARRTTAAVTASRLLPPRAAGLWEVTFSLRPFLALGSLGFGTVSDASVGVRLQDSVHLVAVLEPLAVGIARAGNLVPVAGNVFASYDTRYFEVGLGAGWSEVDSRTTAEFTTYPPTYEYHRVSSGFSIGQVARLGAQDGLHLLVRNTFVLYSTQFRNTGKPTQFHYGGTVGELQVPVGDRSWVVGRGGGGAAGFAYGELGLRMLARGNGGHDSVFVTASLGGASVSGSNHRDCQVNLALTELPPCYEEVSYGGPMVGLAVEWRP